VLTLEPFARLGYASKAAIYAVVGLLAILTATNQGGRITDQNGALRVVIGQPFGRMLLLVLAIGLCGYAVWRLLDAFLDPDRHGLDASGLVTRIGNAIRGCIYGALGLDAIRLLRGARGARGDQAETLTAQLFGFPFGGILVGVIGGVVAIYGVSEVIASFRGRDDPKVDWSAIRSDWRQTLKWISRFGVGVRGALITTLGVFLLRAALTHNPDDAAGNRESMLRLGGLVEGRWFLAVIAAGVLAYAVDQAVHARHRRIRPVM
jgi:hypothetical protein